MTGIEFADDELVEVRDAAHVAAIASDVCDAAVTGPLEAWMDALVARVGEDTASRMAAQLIAAGAEALRVGTSEIERLTAAVWQIRDAMTDQHEMVEHALEIDDCAECREAWSRGDGDFACVSAKRWQRSYSTALSLTIPERPAPVTAASPAPAGGES